MKILYIITQGDDGGAQKYVLALAKYFGGSIAAGSEARQLFKAAEGLQLTTYNLPHLKRRLNPWNDFLAAYEIRMLVKHLNPDIVHLNSSKAGILGSFACIGLGRRVIFTAHGFIFNEPLGFALKNFYLALEKIASDYRNFIITVSEADRTSALNNGIIKANKIGTIHNGIGTINFLEKNEARTQLNLPEHKIIIGCVANFYTTKGLDILIDAIALLEEHMKSKIIVPILGDGPGRKNLEFKIKNLELSAQVRLLGKIDNASKYLKAFDVFVLPSRKEGFPYALLEAMQAGLPIIAGSVGGVPEALGDAGMLIKAEHPKALAGAISYMAQNQQKRAELSQRALERSKLFTEQKMLAETRKIYEQLLSQK